LQKNPEKNGSIGSLVEFNQEKGRWVVALALGNVNFKEENLELMPDNSDVVDDKEEPPTAKIYITGLAAETTDEDLINLFGGVGMIAKEKPKNVRNPGHEDTWPYAVKLYKPGRSDGDACVTYQDPYAAKAAIKTYHRFKFKDSKIGVAYAGQGRKYDPVELTLPWHLREENQGKLGGGEDRGGGKDGGGKGPRPGDWECPSCGTNNYASKTECFKCGAAKPDSGEGGKGRKDKDDKDRGKGSKGRW
jgi:RNA recognition motif-containing protein